MVYQWIKQGTKGSIDNARRPGRGSMMRPNINEESNCLPKNCQRAHFPCPPQDSMRSPKV